MSVAESPSSGMGGVLRMLLAAFQSVIADGIYDFLNISVRANGTE